MKLPIPMGVLASILSLVAFYETYSGHPHFAEWLGNPETAKDIYAGATVVMTLAAGALKGFRGDAKNS
jgi:hypothetical protein